MNQLDQGSQSNAASAEEVAASSEEINAQALQMKRMVGDLNTVILGADSDAEPVAKKPAPSKKTAAPVPVSEKTANVVPISSAKKATVKKSNSPSAPHTASSVIPFDDDESPRKVGTTDGF
jgi:hypothetical protein